MISLLFAFVTSPGQTIQAQERSSDAALCFKGRPLAACEAFVLTEFSVSAWLVEPPGENPPAVVSEFGLMRNVGTRNAIGGSFFVDVGHQEILGGAGVRYRHWLPSNTALDLGLGTPLLGYAALEWVTLKAKLSMGEVIGVVTRIEVGGDTTFWSLGVEGGSAVGVIGSLAAALVGIIAVASFSGPF